MGCGGGLLCEPMAQLGAKVTVDASAAMIAVAKAHAAEAGLKIAYRVGSAEELSQGEQKFDVVTLMEILEHAADVGALIRSAASLVKPDGIMLALTVNRTTKSYLLGIVAAEYVLCWVPAGTHDWRRLSGLRNWRRSLKRSACGFRTSRGLFMIRCGMRSICGPQKSR